MAGTSTSSRTETSTTSGDLAKAIACGADAAVLGAPLAVAAEAAGQRLVLAVGGRAPVDASRRGAPGRVRRAAQSGAVLNGPSDDPYGSLNLVGGLRRSMAKAGYSDLKEFQKVGLSVRA